MSDQFERTVEMFFPKVPPNFLSGSVYRDWVFKGVKHSLPSGFSLKPDGGHEYGIYVTPKFRVANAYGSSYTYRAIMSMKNPLIVNNKGEISPTDLTREDILRLKGQGYDSIASSTTGRLADAYEFVLFDSHQVFVLNPTNQQSFSPSEIREDLSALNGAIDIAVSPGNGDYDPYFQGMANGMILGRHVGFDLPGDPKFLSAPPEWVRDRVSPGPFEKAVESVFHGQRKRKTAHGRSV